MAQTFNNDVSIHKESIQQGDGKSFCKERDSLERACTAASLAVGKQWALYSQEYTALSNRILNSVNY